LWHSRPGLWLRVGLHRRGCLCPSQTKRCTKAIACLPLMACYLTLLLLLASTLLPTAYCLSRFAPLMSNSSDFVLEQHRVYLLREFALQANGEVLCTAYAHSSPDKIIQARFRHAKMTSSWQESEDSSRLSWPLEVISFGAAKLAGRRFRFTLRCLDFEREWESEWPEAT
jgi:hypothetical protein